MAALLASRTGNSENDSSGEVERWNQQRLENVAWSMWQSVMRSEHGIGVRLLSVERGCRSWIGMTHVVEHYWVAVGILRLPAPGPAPGSVQVVSVVGRGS